MSRAQDVPQSRLRASGTKILGAAAVFLLVVLLITSVFGKKGLMEIQRTRKSTEVRLQEFAALEQRKAELQKEIAELQRDPRAVEKEAREKLWLMKKNEVVIVKINPAIRN